MARCGWRAWHPIRSQGGQRLPYGSRAYHVPRVFLSLSERMLTCPDLCGAQQAAN